MEGIHEHPDNLSKRIVNERLIIIFYFRNNCKTLVSKDERIILLQQFSESILH